jgi:2-oxoacid:acceptor oxidoreductase gamma subunit (pyruvate/2-ketoisovalerate family)
LIHEVETLIEIRFHGMGGNGAVVASKLLADAASRSGNIAQSFASYGALRRGGKVESYVRISDGPIRPHCKMYDPDWVILMDESLTEDDAVLSGLKDQGKILINSPRPATSFSALNRFCVYTVDAYGIAEKNNLVLPGGMPVINTTLLGALVKLLEPVRMEDLKKVILRNTSKPQKNLECAELGHRQVISPSRTSGPAEGTADVSYSPTTSPEKYPVYIPEKMTRCSRCQICYITCPSLAIGFQQDPFALHLNKKICTQCGICIEECPRDAIFWGVAENA